MKPGWNGGILNIDFDGVIAQTQAASILFHGGPPPYIKDITHWDSEHVRHIRDDIKLPEFHEILFPYNNAPIAIRGLGASGWWVRIVTQSPEARRELLVNWLNHWGVVHDELVLVPTDNKNVVGPHILVDDRPSTVTKYADEVGPAILVRRPWNDQERGRPAWESQVIHYPIAHIGSWERMVEQIRTWMHKEDSPLWIPGRRMGR